MKHQFYKRTKKTFLQKINEWFEPSRVYIKAPEKIDPFREIKGLY